MYIISNVDWMNYIFPYYVLQLFTVVLFIVNRDADTLFTLYPPLFTLNTGNFAPASGRVAIDANG